MHFLSTIPVMSRRNSSQLDYTFFYYLFEDTCSFKRLFLYFIKECNDFYSISEQDQGSFLPGWKKHPVLDQNASVITTPTVEPTKTPWDFQTGDQLKTFPYWGYKATYSAGGKFRRTCPSSFSFEFDATKPIF